MFVLSFHIMYLFEFLILIEGVKNVEGRKVTVCDNKHHAWNAQI